MIMNSDDIRRIIPHRHPFLMIDGILEMEEGKSVKAVKNVSAAEPHFQGHFPDRHVMPGVLIIEALAQAGACAILKSPEHKGKLAFFAGIDKCRFKRKVIPGDTLVLEVEITRMKGPVGKGTAKATVEGELAASAELTFALGDRQEDIKK